MKRERERETEGLSRRSGPHVLPAIKAKSTVYEFSSLIARPQRSGCNATEDKRRTSGLKGLHQVSVLITTYKQTFGYIQLLWKICRRAGGTKKGERGRERE